MVLNCKITHSKRVYGKLPSHKKILIREDFNNAFQQFKKNKKENNFDYKMLYN
jgi:cation transport regulator ChaB